METQQENTQQENAQKEEQEIAEKTKIFPKELVNLVCKELKSLESWGNVIFGINIALGSLELLSSLLLFFSGEWETIFMGVCVLLTGIFTIIVGCALRRVFYWMAVLEYKALNSK